MMRICEVCGCTDEDGCIDATGRHCHWITDILCSFCTDEEDEGEDDAGPLFPAGSVIKLELECRAPLVTLFTEDDLRRLTRK
jgi:hypothetical protein